MIKFIKAIIFALVLLFSHVKTDQTDAKYTEARYYSSSIYTGETVNTREETYVVNSSTVTTGFTSPVVINQQMVLKMSYTFFTKSKNKVIDTVDGWDTQEAANASEYKKKINIKVPTMEERMKRYNRNTPITQSRENKIMRKMMGRDNSLKSYFEGPTFPPINPASMIFMSPILESRVIFGTKPFVPTKNKPKK